MTLHATHPTGADYLGLVTRLLQDARLVDLRGGLWEAADLQWWWRVDQHDDPSAQAFWLDGSSPVVAAVFTRWGTSYGCDLLGADGDVGEHADALWGFVHTWLADHPDQRVEMLIRDDDLGRIEAARAAGFRPTADGDETGWLAAELRPRVPTLPSGYTLESYSGGAHPMVMRSGPDVAAHLAACSLYRPELDLAIRSDDGSVAGYALFWADPVTGVGLVEPMRVETAQQGRGLSRVLLAAGLDALAGAGCTQLKVSFEPGNEAAVRLYTGAGFRASLSAHLFVRG